MSAHLSHNITMTRGLAETYRRVPLKMFRVYLHKWRGDLVYFFSRPGTAVSTFLFHVFVFWLSLKQVRLAFRVLTFLRLTEFMNLRGVIESHIYLVLIVMVTCFVWLDLAAFKICIVWSKSKLQRLLARKKRKVPGKVIRKNPPRACKKYTPY